MDRLTVLETAGPALTKIYKSDGTTDTYGEAASFFYKEKTVRNLDEVAALLAKLHKNKKRCLIRGKPKGEGMQPGLVEGSVARTNANFDDQPLHWFMVDVDGFEPFAADPVTEPEAAIDEYIVACLPPEFRTASYYWQLSSSAGMPGKESILKAHLHFWSRTPYTTAQLYAWATDLGKVVDRALYRRVQVHYTADPIFEEGRIDPVPVRAGWHQGESDEVDLFIREDILAGAREQGAGTGNSDQKLTDPSEKEGLIGAFHKAFDPERVLLDFLEGEFEQVSQRRYTWVNGGGTPEGVWVHDDQMHVGSSHNTWPIDGIANLWDLVRVFKFGKEDEPPAEVDEFERMNYETLPVGQRPSDQAMRAWAATLPELQAALQTEREMAMAQFREAIRNAGSIAVLETTVARSIQEASLFLGEREILAAAYNARLSEIGARPLGLAQVRRLLAPPARSRALNNAPSWANQWVWVSEKDAFMNTETKLFMSERSFNAKYDREMEPDNNGNVPHASEVALRVWGVPVVDRAVYNPCALNLHPGKVIFREGKIACVNTYRLDGIPDVPDRLTKSQRRAIEIVEEHAALLIPDETERALFLDFLAYCVQHPGKKIRWAPLIKGVPGDGKSAFAVLMQHVMGGHNVRILDSGTLESSDFTGWRTGQCFTAIEEMKLHGHNRYDVFNKLKTPIANDTVEVHYKGRDPRVEPNTTNYMLLTNFEDGMPIDDNDRRILVLRSPFITKDDLQNKLKSMGFGPGEYHDRLFDTAIKAEAGALRKWLLERKFHPEFKPEGRAYETKARALVVELTRRDDDDAISALLEGEATGVYKDLVSVTCLNRELLQRFDIKLASNRAKATLMSLGFDRYSDNQITWRGERHRLYYKGTRPADAVTALAQREAAREARELEKDFEA